MTRPQFTLTVATSADGFIARAPDDNPALWASEEEQALFFADVEAADWSIMGRHTQAAADRPKRRRILFSTTVEPGWKRPTQIWLNPENLTPADLPAYVSHVYPMRHALILGGTGVHDWFLTHRAIDRVHLSVEPVRFGAGLPVFRSQEGDDPRAVFEKAGFRQISSQRLNDIGTEYSIWEPIARHAD